MIKNVFIAILVVVVALLCFVATRPATFHIERTTTIAASTNAVYAQVVDFHKWPDWSPWEKLDPSMTKNYGGADSGPGATYEWAGNSQVGEGKMTITDVQPNQKVAIKLEFLKPFKATNATAFTLVPEGEATKVTWTLDGHHDFMGKAVGLFMNMDKMIGGDFEKGLASLKGVAEGSGS